MSHGKYKKRVTCSSPPPISKGQHELLAKCLSKPDATVRKQYTRGKYNQYIQDGQYDLEAIQSNLSKIFQPQSRHARKSQPGKKDNPEKKSKVSKKTEPKNHKPLSPLADENEVKNYLNETIGELCFLEINELWRRNELEKLLMARLKRHKEEHRLIEIDTATKTIELILSTAINNLESLGVKAGPLLAVENDAFECEQILNKEMDFIRNQIISDLETVKAGKYVS